MVVQIHWVHQVGHTHYRIATHRFDKIINIKNPKFLGKNSKTQKDSIKRVPEIGRYKDIQRIFEIRCSIIKLF